MTAENRKKIEKLLIIGVIAIFVVSSVSYAFFQAQTGIAGTTNVNVGTSTTDNLSFAVDGAINLNINQFDFAEGAGNLVSNTQATATLLANNATNTATYSYYVYFNIDSNDFIYTTVDSKPEIILTVTKPDGTEVTSIAGLNYVQNVQTITSDGSTQTVNGFDITTATGLFAVASQYSITANSTSATTQEWNFTVSFINLDTDQQGNTGKSMDAEVIIQEDLIPTTLAKYVTTQVYTGVDGENGLYYHDGIGNYTNANLEAGDNSYRYAGANPNNYVCFGSDEKTCPVDNLYRIIGVFNGHVKLIKVDYATSSLLGTDGAYQGSTNYYWNNSTSSNSWSESNLNTVNLNTNYINSLGSEWSDLITESTWQVGGISYETLSGTNAQTTYNYEVGINATNTTYQAKIGLMYVSDYGYAASPEAWNLSVVASDGINDYRNTINTENNWLLPTNVEWTISGRSDSTIIAFGVSYIGYMGNYAVDSNGYGVRPSFSLASTVELTGGTGTSTDPYILNLS